MQPERVEFTDEERSGLYKAIHTRRDVRSHFMDKPISPQVMARILHAAHRAPSVGFSQPWNFILIRDGAIRTRIKESFEEERRNSSEMLKGERRSKYDSLKLEGIMESFLNLCVTYDPTRFGPFVIGRGSIPQTGIYSVCCAVQNLWLAARSEGVGVGWVSILSNDTIRECLRLPPHVEPVAYLCMGYAREFAKRPDLEEAGWLPRTRLSSVVAFERWEGESGPQWTQLHNEMDSIDMEHRD